MVIVLDIFQNMITGLMTAWEWLTTPSIDFTSWGWGQVAPVWLLTGAGVVAIITIHAIKLLLPTS